MTGIVILTFTGLVGIEIYNNLHVDRIESFNASFQLIQYGNGKQALADFQGRRCTEKVDYIESGASTGRSDSLTVFIHHHKKGYLNCNTGATAIPARFDDAWQFDTLTNLAAVGLDNKLGFVNKTGEVVIQIKYPYFSGKPEDEFTCIFQDGTCVIPSLNSYGLINSKGEEMLPAIYSWISESSHGYRILMRNDKAGLYDVKKKRNIWPLRFDCLDFTDTGIVVTDTLEGCFTKYMVSFDLKTRFPVYDAVSALYSDEAAYGDDVEFSGGKYSGYSSFTIDDKTGVLDDETGNVILPARFDDVTYYAGDRFKVTLGDYIGIIDITANMIGYEFNFDSHE